VSDETAPVADLAVPGEAGSAPQTDWLRGAFEAAWAELAPIGASASGGYDRFAWTGADLELRAWFARAAARRHLSVELDGNGNLWAWWGRPGSGAIVTGSHLDSVPGGGAFDGPLGVVGGLLAVDLVRRRRSTPPPRPLAVVDFADEEGARFGVACVGSRLLTGSLEPETAAELADRDGVSLAEAIGRAGVDTEHLGRDEERLGRVAAYIELHIEQGRALAGLGAPVGVATGIWPHGRWRLRFDGAPDHAGTAAIADRHDPMLPFAAAVAEARASAIRRSCRCTVGRAAVHPNATNAVAGSVEGWLDARAPDDATLAAAVHDVVSVASAAADEHGVELVVEPESISPAVTFDETLRRRIVRLLSSAAATRGGRGGSVPEISTAAGHDAGILSARVPAAMLFARNPTGVSHSPAEEAPLEDCLAGIEALADVLEDLLWH